MKPAPIFHGFLKKLMAISNRLVFYTRLIEMNTHLEKLVKARTIELEEANRQLIEKEEALLFQNEALKMKEELLTAHNEELAAQEEELTDYISRLSEQQERERLVRWIVTSIRESLELDQVITRTTQEVGYLLKVDRCFVTAYKASQKSFRILETLYRSSEAISPVRDADILANLCPKLKHQIIEQLEPVIISEMQDYEALNPFQAHYESLGIRAAVMLPLLTQNKLLGTLVVHQVNTSREWSDQEIETLKDIAQQVSIAVYQANLYHEVQEATRLKSEFLANMSHEFRTPLNAIIGFSEMILSEHYGPLTQKQQDYIQNVMKSGQHLLTLVNDILDLSKVESGNMDLHQELFNLPKTILEVTNIIKGMAYKKKIEVQLQIEPEVHLAYADPARFKQILYNLLSNAVKFTPEMGQIAVHASLLPNQQKILVVAVKDTGIGISQLDREKIFREFQQIDASYARKQEGSGLGLALTRKLVELHKGTIEFTSLPGKGTTFTVKLPCHISGELPKALLEKEKQPFNKIMAHLNHQVATRQVKVRTDDPLLETMLPTESLPKGTLLLVTPIKDPLLNLQQPFKTLPYGFKILTANEALLEMMQSPSRPEFVLPQGIVLDTFYLESPNSMVETLFKTLRTNRLWADLPVILGSFNLQQGGLQSLGCIDYWIEPFSEAHWLRQIDKIRCNLLKESQIHLLGLGEDAFFTPLQESEVCRREARLKVSHFQPTGIDWMDKVCSTLPDLILLEMPYPLEPQRLAILEMLKCKIETKYIPIVLIGSLSSPSDEAERPGTAGVQQSALLTRQKLPQKHSLTRLLASTNLARDIEYALRMNKETS